MDINETYIVPVQSRGQMSIPLKVRKDLGLTESVAIKKVMVTKVGKEEFLLKPVKRTLEDAYGSYQLPPGKSLEDLIEETENEMVNEILHTDS